MPQFFVSGRKSTGASSSVLPMDTKDQSLLGWTGWISLQSKGLSRVFSNTTIQKQQFFTVHLSLWSKSPYIITGKIIALTRWTFVNQVLSLLFNKLSRFLTAFLPRSKHLLITAAVTICSDFGAQENKLFHCFHCFPSICHEVIGLDAMISVF